MKYSLKIGPITVEGPIFSLPYRDRNGNDGATVGDVGGTPGVLIGFNDSLKRYSPLIGGLGGSLIVASTAGCATPTQHYAEPLKPAIVRSSQQYFKEGKGRGIKKLQELYRVAQQIENENPGKAEALREAGEMAEASKAPKYTPEKWNFYVITSNKSRPQDSGLVKKGSHLFVPNVVPIFNVGDAFSSQNNFKSGEYRNLIQIMEGLQYKELYEKIKESFRNGTLNGEHNYFYSDPNISIVAITPDGKEMQVYRLDISEKGITKDEISLAYIISFTNEGEGNIIWKEKTNIPFFKFAFATLANLSAVALANPHYASTMAAYSVMEGAIEGAVPFVYKLRNGKKVEFYLLKDLLINPGNLPHEDVWSGTLRMALDASRFDPYRHNKDNLHIIKMPDGREIMIFGNEAYRLEERNGVIIASEYNEKDADNVEKFIKRVLIEYFGIEAMKKQGEGPYNKHHHGHHHGGGGKKPWYGSGGGSHQNGPPVK